MKLSFGAVFRRTLFGGVVAFMNPAASSAYPVDCAILLCLAGGWPASAECSHARAVFIRRITPWPIEPPLQIWRCPMGIALYEDPTGPLLARVQNVALVKGAAAPQITNSVFRSVESSIGKAIAAQIIQLINLNKLDRRGDVEFNFSDGKAIKKIHVSQKISDEVSRGRLCIARLGESYEVVPKPVADKIRERDDETVVVYNQSSAVSSSEVEAETSADDDHYAQFEIPDDLMW